MAIVRSEQSQKIYDSSNAGGYNVERLNTNEYNGRVRLFYGHFKGENIASKTTIELIDVPAGRILPLSKIYYGNGGGSSTVTIGHAAYVSDTGVNIPENPTALLGSTDTAAAGSAELAADKAGFILKGKATITATTSKFAAGQAIDAFILCAVD